MDTYTKFDQRSLQQLLMHRLDLHAEVIDVWLRFSESMEYASAICGANLPGEDSLTDSSQHRALEPSWLTTLILASSFIGEGEKSHTAYRR